VRAVGGDVGPLVVGDHAGEHVEAGDADVGVGGGELDPLDETWGVGAPNLADADDAVQPVAEPAVTLAVPPRVGGAEMCAGSLGCLWNWWAQLATSEESMA
jgi:hypothetical protein